MPHDSLSESTAQVRRFADERDWHQLHSPKNLAAARRKVAINAEKYPEYRAKGSSAKYSER